MLLTVFLLLAQASRQRGLNSFGWGIGEWIVLVIGLCLIFLAARRVFGKNETANPKQTTQQSQQPTQQKIAKDDLIDYQDIINKLKDLQKLKEAGILSDEEIEQEKWKIIIKPNNEPGRDNQVPE